MTGGGSDTRSDKRDTRVRLVCFDLGGVVVRICRSWREGCERVGLDYRGDAREIFDGDGWAALNGAYQRGEIDVMSFCERFSGLLTGMYSPDEILRVHRAWVVDEYAGVGALVERLHGGGLETAVLSNSCGEHWASMEQRFPTFRRLRNKLGSHEIALRKPDPKAYEAVEHATGARGAAIVFFDDTPENVEAARAVGWHAAVIDPIGDTAAQMIAALGRHGLELEAGEGLRR